MDLRPKCNEWGKGVPEPTFNGDEYGRSEYDGLVKGHIRQYELTRFICQIFND